MTDREKMMKRLAIANFAIDDVKLFLDTHPTDRAALDYYHKYRKLRDQVLEEYTSRFGPITADMVESTDQWTWVENPWPWDNPAEGEV